MRFNKSKTVNKSHPLSRYTTNGRKSFPQKNWYILTLLLGSLSSATENKILPCDNFSSALFICLTPVFQGQFALIGCMVLMKEFLSLITVAMKIGKIHFFKNQWKMLQEEKWFIKNMNITDANHHWKNWVDWILDTWWDKILQPQKGIFEKRSPKS